MGKEVLIIIKCLWSVRRGMNHMKKVEYQILQMNQIENKEYL